MYCSSGLQAQTAECLVVAEVATSRMLVALNKIDLLPEIERSKSVKKAAKRLSKTLGMTKFATAPMVPVAARAVPSSREGEVPDSAISTKKSGSGGSISIGIEELKAQLVALVPEQPRSIQVRYECMNV